MGSNRGFSGFRAGARERREADLFFADLMGVPPRRSAERALDEGFVAEQQRLPWDPRDGDRGGVDALWRHHQQAAGGLLTRCAFFGPNNVEVTEQQLRQAVVAAARAESARWHTSAGAPVFESDVTMFGHLVRYYLAVISNARPDTLTAMQAAAIAATTSYGALPTQSSTAATVTTEVRRIRRALLTGAPGTTVPADLATQVETALRRARDAHLDTGAFSAWSAVWVSSCVRTAGITLGLEAMVGTTHVGQDELLRVATAHREYAREAFLRTSGPGARKGTYHAFDPVAVAPELGDIIVQDRRPANGFTFANMPPPNRMSTHGDIVIEVNAGDVVTLGGNLGSGTPREESVRRRRYPLDARGRLVVDHTRRYSQEDNTGALPALPAAVAATPIDPKSTGRIFTLLKPVQVCAAIPGQPYRGGVLT